jgi:hypothetical protein
MKTTKQKAEKPRLILMSVPGREEDGSDAAWFVFDRVAMASKGRFATMAEASEALRRMRERAK